MKYSEKTLKRFTKPKFAGEIKSPDAVGEEGNLKCLLPDEKIHVTNSIIPIEHLSKNDKIISCNGKYNSITRIYKRRFSGKVITIKSKLGKTTLTADHLVYAIKIPQKRKFFDTIIKKTLTPAWYHAEDLEKRDIVLYPLFKEVVDMSYVKPDLSTAKFDFRSIKIPSKLRLNKDFLRLCGYFLAEGHASLKMCQCTVTFAFNINEKEYVEDVRQICKKNFGLNVYIKEQIYNKTTVIKINNVFVARLFRNLFGHGAQNKKIPHFMMLLPPEKQKSLLLGMWRGDGHISLKRKFPRASYTTISEQLIHQTKLLLLRQKIVPSLYTENEKLKQGVLHRQVYRIHVGDRSSLIKLMAILGINHKYVLNEKTHSWFDDNYFYTPLSAYNSSDYKGLVYNLEVPKNHSYSTNSLLVHNCGDMMRIFIKVDKGKKADTDISKRIIKDIKFQTYGCIAAIAATDALCEIAKGKTLEDAKKLTWKDVINDLGEVPPIKYHCSIMGIGALKDAIKKYEENIGNKI